MGKLDEWAKQIATKALVKYGASKDIAKSFVEQLLKDNQ